MESVEAKVRYVIYSSVVSVEEHKRIVSVSKDGVAIEETLGWFVHIQGSFEALFLSLEEPNLKSGDEIRITLEKANAKPQQPPIERSSETPPTR